MRKIIAITRVSVDGVMVTKCKVNDWNETDDLSLIGCCGDLASRPGLSRSASIAMWLDLSLKTSILRA